jgi:hypothetical protein
VRKVCWKIFKVDIPILNDFQIYAQRVVYAEISFGTTSDYYWVGTLTSTYNQ